MQRPTNTAVGQQPPVRVRPHRAASFAAGLACVVGLSGQADTPPQDDHAAHEASDARSFRGWNTLRVLVQEGSPRRMRSVDLDRDGADELIVVNPRQARIEIYQHAPDATETLDPKLPNQLPKAPGFRNTKLPIDKLPVDVLPIDLYNDGQQHLLVLTASPRKLIAYQPIQSSNQQFRFEPRLEWDLKPGDYSNVDALIQTVQRNGARHALISTEQGVQTIDLSVEALNKAQANRSAQWLLPRNKTDRSNWWLVDLDQDGHTDFIEHAGRSGGQLHWARGGVNGFGPTRPLFDAERGLDEAQLVETPSADTPVQFALALRGQDEDFGRYVLGESEESPLGGQDALPLEDAAKRAWASLTIAGRPALVVLDNDQPSFRLFTRTAEGWMTNGDRSVYPTLTDIKSVTALPAKPGHLLLKVKGAATPYVCHWDGQRITYPKPLTQDAWQAAESRPSPNSDTGSDTTSDTLLGIGRVENTVWWAVQVGDHTDLYTWASGQKQPHTTRFEQTGSKVNEALWIGGQRLLIQEQFARSPKLASIHAGQTSVTESAAVKTLKLDALHLFPTDTAPDSASASAGNTPPPLRLGRMVDGVMQWLGEDLHPVDQVMLPDGKKLLSLTFLNDGSAWALTTERDRVHRLQPDASGILRSVQQEQIPVGSTLINDPVLGLLLTQPDALTGLRPGSSPTLMLADTLPRSLGRPATHTNAAIDDSSTADITGDGVNELIFLDAGRHQLTVLQAPSAEQGTFKPLISWQVFEDSKYPYGADDRSRAQREPRSIHALDIDGDGRQDLALLSQNRLLIYLADEQSLARD